MAYGLYLYKNVTTKGNRVVRLEIWSKDYTGSSAEIDAMGVSPFSISIDNSGGNVEEPLIKTNLSIVIKDTNQIDYDIFFTPDATKFKVIIKVAGVDYWVGYLTPDSYSESLSFRNEIVLTARDNLGMLSEIKYERSGKRATMRTLLNEAIALISFGNTLEYRQKKTSGTLNILDAYIRCDRFIGKTWADVVQTILHDCGLQMRFVGAAKYAIYDIGEIVNLGTTISTQTFKFIEESGQREIIPAARTITLNQDYGSVDNSYDGVLADSEYSFRAARSVSQPITKDISTPQVFTINYYDPFSIVWTGAGGSIGIVNPNEWAEAPSTIMLTGDLYTFTNYRPAIYYSQIMPITAGNVEVKFQVSNLVKYPATSGGDYVWKDYFFEYIKDPSSSLVEWFGAKYQVKFRCNIFLDGVTKTYIMRERWEEYIDEGPTATAKYLTFILPSGGNAGEFPNLWEYNAKDEELKFNIQTIPEDGTLRIAFYPYELIGKFVQMYPSVEPQDIKNNVPLTYPILVKNISIKYPAFEVGGLESSAIINSAHNVAYNIDLELGQVPQGIGDSATMYGGLFNTGVNFYKALGNFFVTAGTEYHLSELIGREVANIYKEQREKLSGTIITDVNFSAMPSFGKTFTDGVKYYAINSGTLDFISEQMQVEMIEVEPYLYEDFTFIEATIDTGGSSLGSGETEFIQWSAAGNAKRIYELDTASEADQGGAFVFIDKSGLTAAKKVPISSLLVDAYTKTESDSRFASIDGDLTQDFSAKKLTTATLLLPQSAPTLASGEAAIYSLDSGFSGETPSGAGSVTSIALTMPTGFSVSGSPITESGTFGVTFASGYFLPTTTQFASKADVSLIGAANGITPLDSGGKVALQYLPSTLLKYMGVWNASTNSPTLTSPDTNRKGQVWNVSVAGTQFGLDFKLGDWLIYNDSGVAEKSDNSDDVTSVNGYTGAVTLKTSDIAEQTNLYYTDARVKAYSDLNYLGISAKAADSDKLDNLDSSVFVYGDNSTRTKSTSYNLTSYFPSGFYYNNSQFVIHSSYYGVDNVAGLSIYANDATNGDLYFLVQSGVGGGTERTIWQSGNSNSTSFAWSAAKLTSTTLILPQSTPSLTSGEMAIYGLESGFSGETPSGAGSVTSISMVVPTGLSVTPATITESGTFTISYASGYSIPTNTKQGEWDSAYTLRHNAITLGTANGLSLSIQELSLGLASTSTNGALSSTDWNTFNGKQAKLIGTGASSLVRVNTSGVIAYDDSTYLTGNQTITLSGIITGSGTTAITTEIADGVLSIAKTNGLQTALDGKLSTTGKAADSDKLDGQDSTYFATAAQMNAANLSSGYLPYWNGSSLVNSGIWTNGTNIGIDSSANLARLDVNVTNKANEGIVLSNGGAAFSRWGMVNYGVDNSTYIGSTSNNSFLLISAGAERLRIGASGNIDIGYMGARSEKFAVDGTTYFNGNSQVVGSLIMTENINTNLRIPKVAPTSPTSGEYYFYVVE